MNRSPLHSNKSVSINGRPVTTNWRKVKLTTPENLQDRIRANEGAVEEIKKQKTTTAVGTTLNSL